MSKIKVEFRGSDKSYPKEVIDNVYEYLLNGEAISIAGKDGVISRLESLFQEKYGQKYAVAMNSGTNCIFAAFFAIGINEGDEVIAPAYGFHACISSIYLRGGVPVFCDCQKDNLNICPNKFERLITPKTKAVVVVHNWGEAADIEEIVRISHKHNIYVIEDCSHAHGSEYKNRVVGQFGDISIFSLQANKTVYAGEGGIFLTSNKEIYEKAILLGRYRGRGYLHELDEKEILETGYGLKFRMHPLGAVIAIQTFKMMDSVIEKREKSVKIIEEAIEKSKYIQKMRIPEYVTKHSYYGYKLMLKNEDEELNEMYIKTLQAEGVIIHKSTYVINPELELFKYALKQQCADLENIEKIKGKLVSLEIPQGECYIEQAKAYAKAFEKVENYMDDKKGERNDSYN